MQRLDAQKQFHWIYISVYQRMTKRMLERELATKKVKKEEKKRTRTMKSKFPIGFGSIERHISENTSAHNACE